MSITDKDIPQIEKLKELISKSRNVVITCHLSPDGDALGSSLGLKHVLSCLGIECRVITPDCPPQSLSFLPGYNDVMPLSRYETLVRSHVNRADLIFCLDYNELKRVDRLAPYIEGTGVC